MLVNAIGQKATHTISNRQLGTMDAYPAVVVDIVPGESPTGQPSPVATIIVERVNLAGETFLAQADVPTRFLLPRVTPVESLDVTAEVTLGRLPEGGLGLTSIVLTAEATVPGSDDAAFQAAAAQAKVGCPISKALAAVPITLEARLRS